MHLLCFLIKRLLRFGSMSGISPKFSSVEMFLRINIFLFLYVDRKNVTRKTGLLLTCSPVSSDLFKDLDDIPLYRQFVK